MVNIDIGIDLGTSNTVIYIKDKGIVVNQPSVVAYEAKSKKIIAVGNKAKKMLGYDPEWSFDRGIKAAIEWYRENL